MDVSLIEQLGGYDKAKDKATELDYDLNNLEFLSGGSAMEAMYERLESIEKALLQYRREHNLFEIGDYIILTSDNIKKEWEFYQLTEDDLGSHWINLVDFRHATDEEVRAGKRL